LQAQQGLPDSNDAWRPKLQMHPHLALPAERSQPASLEAMPSDPTPVPVPATATLLDVQARDVSADTCVISIRGELDLAAAARLKAALVALSSVPNRRGIVLDLSDLSYLDSTGLAVLIAFRRRLDSSQRLAIANASRQVTRLLTLTGLLSSFDTFTSVQDAIRYVEETGPPEELPLSPDAALVLGLAATALPFADSYAAEARCWQRILGSENDAVAAESGSQSSTDSLTPAGDSSGHMQRLDRVLTYAARFARERTAGAIRTGDIVRGAVAVYGSALDLAA
jgi:anti-sigma B factor antagonist